MLYPYGLYPEYSMVYALEDPYEGATASQSEASHFITPADWRAAKVRDLHAISRSRLVVGRRERSMVWLIGPVFQSRQAAGLLNELVHSGFPAFSDLTYGTLMDLCRQEGGLHDSLSSLDLRVNLSGIDPGRYVVTEVNGVVHGLTTAKDPEVHYGLQDLGWLVGYELAAACQAFSDPDVWYPGVDDGIEPVSDDHVALVIAATQRELDRERRRSLSSAPLAELPLRVQRAFAERRRFIYKTYGIGREQWQQNKWSFWDVQDDPAWMPPWLS